VLHLNRHAEITWRAGRTDEARATATRVVGMIEGAWGSSHISLAAPLTVLGEIELTAGNYPLAIRQLERALVLRVDSDPMFRGDTAFALARALAAHMGSARQARKVGLQARDAYAAAGPRRAAELARVETWLAAL
jgi:tetratricopeptide (TPR) repeat protein